MREFDNLAHHTVLRIAATLLVLFTIGVQAVCSQNMEIHHLDVGQGDATFIVVRDSNNTVANTVLIDGGLPRCGQQIIDYITDTLGLHAINYVIATHYDRDHVGGLAVILDYARLHSGVLTVDSIFDRGDAMYNHPEKGKEYKTAAAQYGTRRQTLTPGKTIVLFNDGAQGTHTGIYSITAFCVCVNGRVYVDTSPPYNAITRVDPDENDLSTGFLFRYGKFKYLTCGDIGGKSGFQGGTCDGSYGCNFADLETNVMEYCNQVSAYKINHHGSRCSTNDAWVQQTAAPVAIISSGKNGRYKHPRQEVLNALQASDSVQNYYLTANINYYGRNLGTKGLLNPSPGQPIDLIVNRVNYGINIMTASVFTVAGRRYNKY